MLRYYAFRIGNLIIPHLPSALGYRLASWAGDLIYLFFADLRGVVRDNVGHALGNGAAPPEIARTTRAVFRNAAKNYFDLFRVPRFNLERLERLVTLHGLENLEEAIAAGRGVIVATAHLGNLDLVAQVAVSLGIELCAIVEPLEPEPLFRLVTSLRESRGLAFVPASPKGLKEALRHLRRGGVVAVACDRDIQGQGYRLEFLGEETHLPVGAVELARRTGAAIVPAFSIRRPDNRFDLYVEPSFPCESGESLEDNLRRLTAPLEKYIRRYPDQWVIFKPLWDRAKA